MIGTIYYDYSDTPIDQKIKFSAAHFGHDPETILVPSDWDILGIDHDPSIILRASRRAFSNALFAVADGGLQALMSIDSTEKP